MTKEQITRTIKNHVRDKRYTHTEMHVLCGISSATWFDRLNKSNWKVTEILALQQLEIIK